MVLNKKLGLFIIVLSILSRGICYAADAPDTFSSDLKEAYSLKESLQDIEGSDDRKLAIASLRDKFLELACKYQGSTSEADQNLAPLCFIEAARLLPTSYEVPESIVQGSMSDAAGYDFGTMEAFLSKVDKGQKFRIVFAFDGGGIRGVIPARFVKLIEELTQRQMFELGDLFGGASVGAIIASALNKPDPVPASKLVDLFCNRGEEIFPQHTGFWSKITAPLRFIAEMFIYSRYSPAPLEKVLLEYFGETWLHESLKPLLVATIQTTNKDKAADEYFFNSLLAKTVHGENYRLKDVNRATSAATTYFPAAVIDSYDNTRRRFIDAGLTVNNPAQYTYSRAKKLFPDDNILVVSFGTGKPKNLGAIPANSGAARSAKALISNMMAINSEHTHWTFVDQLFPGDGYVRVQCELEKDIDLDDVSRENIAYLSERADAKTAEIQAIAKFLADNFVRR